MKIPYKTKRLENGDLEVSFRPKRSYTITDDMIKWYRHCFPANAIDAHENVLDAAIGNLYWDLIDENGGLGFKEFNRRMGDCIGDIISSRKDDVKFFENVKKLRKTLDDFTFGYTYKKD